MKIDGWHIDGYGVHHELAASELPDGLTIVTGPNEAGKTTLQDFLVGMLFGFTATNRPDHHAPLRGGAYGGRLQVSDDDGTAFTIHRGARRSSLRITGPDGPVADPEAELRRLLGGATKDLYLALFAVHTDELDELKALTDDEVRDRVFSAGILGAGRTAQAALRQLGGERDELWKPGARSADKYLLRRLRDELTEARGRLADARREATGLPGLVHRIGAIEADRDRAKAARSELQDRRSLLFIVSNQWPTWAEAAEARGELDQLGVVEPLPADARATLEQLVARRDDLRAHATEATDALADAQAEAAALEAPGPALAHAAAIGAVAAGLPVERERLATVGRLGDELATAERELAAALAELGPHASEAWLDEQPVDPAAASELRTLAAAVATAEQALTVVDDAAARARAAHEDDVADHQARRSALAERPAHPVDRARQAVEAANTLVTLLTQRDVVEHRLAVATQPAAVVAAPTPPAATPTHLAPALGVVAIVALASGLAAVATGAPVIGGAVALLGVVLGALAASARRTPAIAAAPVEEPAAPAGTTPAELAHQLAEIDRAVEPLLATFGLSGRPTLTEATNLRVRAEQLAAEATQLERDRTELDARTRALDARAARIVEQHAADRRAATAALDAARAAWSAWLAERQLPATLDATGAADLLDALTRARSQLLAARTARQALAAATAAHEAWAAEVVALARTTGLADAEAAAAHPIETIERLDAERRGAEAAAQAQAHQQVAVDAAQGHHDRAVARAAEAATELDQQLAALGAATLDEAFELVARADRAAQLRRTIAQADRDLTTSVGRDPERLDAARALLTRADPVRWQHELAEFADTLVAIDGRIDDLTAEHAHLCAERDAIERSADVAAAELRVADLEAQLADALVRYATLATAHRVVEATLARYQRERQPDVVKRAAIHFAQITDGRYPRLEVRDRDIVAIDHAEREVRADQLSKGTAQQLYLCMRFALAESYARTTRLPLLLDDIAVHADDGRHPRVADTIAAVAADHQVLVFTGHERTVAQLRAARPDARTIELPASGPARRIGLAVS